MHPSGRVRRRHDWQRWLPHMFNHYMMQQQQMAAANGNQQPAGAGVQPPQPQPPYGGAQPAASPVDGGGAVTNGAPPAHGRHRSSMANSRRRRTSNRRAHRRRMAMPRAGRHHTVQMCAARRMEGSIRQRPKRTGIRNRNSSRHAVGKAEAAEGEARRAAQIRRRSPSYCRRRLRAEALPPRMPRMGEERTAARSSRRRSSRS